MARHGVVAAALDVSDGLVQDVGHLCRAGGCGAEIRAADLPLSAAARATLPAMLPRILTGGDDYELAMAVRPEQAARLAGSSRARHLHRPLRRRPAARDGARCDGRGDRARCRRLEPFRLSYQRRNSAITARRQSKRGRRSHSATESGA